MQILHPRSSKPWWAIAAVLLAVTVLKTHAPPYAIDWYEIGGGAGTSTGGIYQVSATIGHFAGRAASIGADFSLVGGFTSIITVIETTGLPNLSIAPVGKTVVVFWPNTARCKLLQTSDLAGGNWTASDYTITAVNGTNTVTLNSPTGNLFFRLSKP